MTPSDHLVLELLLAAWAVLSMVAAFHLAGRLQQTQEDRDVYRRKLSETREELEVARLAAEVESEAETLPPGAA